MKFPSYDDQGNDGGTIVRRADIVRVKDRSGASGSKVDQVVLARVKATTCALSHQSLRHPVVSDALGRLYNKDAVVKYLLKRAEDSGGVAAAVGNGNGANSDDVVAGHLRGLKDVRSLKLESNPKLSNHRESHFKDGQGVGHDDEEAPAPFVCPLTTREMNGKHRFVYLVPCGCVMSEMGLRAVVTEQQQQQQQRERRRIEAEKKDANGGEKAVAVVVATAAAAAAADEEKTKEDHKTTTCPVCGMAFSASCIGKERIEAGGDVVALNATEEEEESAMRKAMDRAREVEAKRKREKKAAAASKTDGEEDPAKVSKEERKRARKEQAAQLLAAEEQARSKRHKPSAGTGTAGQHTEATLTAAGQLAAQARSSTQLNGGKELSAAMRSIYGLDKKKQEGETWMTRGTFNRFA